MDASEVVNDETVDHSCEYVIKSSNDASHILSNSTYNSPVTLDCRVEQ